MKKNNKNMLCFSSIHITKPVIKKNKASVFITLHPFKGSSKSFQLKAVYEHNLTHSDQSLLNVAFCMPLLNYGLFTKKFTIDFSLEQSDFNLLTTLNTIFSKDIFVNKILQRRANYILPEYIPDENKITKADSNPKATISPTTVNADNIISNTVDSNHSGILSSGGKESLLTYGLLKECGSEVFPFYINESGGHWRTALDAYRYHKNMNSNTERVWTNVDRFYNFMLDNLPFIRSDYRSIRADTYPIRLCIFPFYVIILLPLFVKNHVGNLLIGSEFDDIRTTPTYDGINHYYGVYDQHQDFDILMNKWYSKRLPGLVQWSAVRGISGLIVERILIRRYPDLAKHQRSCHSCHIENNKIIPCGTCSKCMGVILYLFANYSDPKIMNFKERDINNFTKRIKSSNLRLDQDEKDYAFFLIQNIIDLPDAKQVDHVEQIHIDPLRCSLELIPKRFRSKLLNIIGQYTKGYCELKNKQWIHIKIKEKDAKLLDF